MAKPKQPEAKVLIYTPYIIRKGKVIRPKNAKVFRFYVSADRQRRT